MESKIKNRITKEVDLGVKKQMIVARTDAGYICKAGNTVFEICHKNYYEDIRKDIDAIKEPSVDELIELGKQSHPFYTKQSTLNNIDAQIAEIDKFEQEHPEEKI